MDFGNVNLLNLEKITYSSICSEVSSFFVAEEDPIQSFQAVRDQITMDQVVFTNRRVFVVNVQETTEKKRLSYFSYPYSKIQYYGVETAGALDIGSELVLMFNNGTHLRFGFESKADIQRICTCISNAIL